jgi:hypothetical protein
VGNWVFTQIVVDEQIAYRVGYFVNSSGNFAEVIRVGDIVSAIKLTNILNGGEANLEEIIALTTVKQ